MKKQEKALKTNPKMEKNSKSDKSSLFKFFNSPIPIIIVLGLLVVVLILYIKIIANSVTLYSFGGYNDDITFLNGTIYIGRDVNYFGDSKIKYDGKDIELYEFEIGYYIRRAEGDIKLAVVNSIEDMKDKGASLKSIFENSDFSFTESHKDANFLSDVNVENLDKLIFKVQGKDKKGNEVKMEVPLEISKITN